MDKDGSIGPEEKPSSPDDNEFLLRALLFGPHCDREAITTPLSVPFLSFFLTKAAQTGVVFVAPLLLYIPSIVSFCYYVWIIQLF